MGKALQITVDEQIVEAQDLKIPAQVITLKLPPGEAETAAETLVGAWAATSADGNAEFSDEVGVPIHLHWGFIHIDREEHVKVTGVAKIVDLGDTPVEPASPTSATTQEPAPAATS